MKQIAIRAAAHRPLRDLVCWKVPGRRGDVALTFDDGPHPRHTPPVLAELARRDVRATFFVLGSAVEKHGGLFREIVDAGHEIGIHGYEHTLVDLPRQVDRTAAILRQAGVQARLFRPPYGRWSAAMLLAMAGRGLTTCLWSFDVDDSRRHEGKVSRRRSFDELRAGDIVLMHDDNPVCAAELPALLDAVSERRLMPVRLSELLGRRPHAPARRAPQASGRADHSL
jgi:peptidoglycan/xylan/chitin deacetylase (PgdA/CDA1 family)